MRNSFFIFLRRTGRRNGNRMHPGEEEARRALEAQSVFHHHLRCNTEFHDILGQHSTLVQPVRVSEPQLASDEGRRMLYVSSLRV